MEKKWFVLHALSGQENKAKESIERRKQIEEVEDLVGDILIPTETVSEVKQGKKTTTTRKFFPGMCWRISHCMMIKKISLKKRGILFRTLLGS